MGEGDEFWQHKQASGNLNCLVDIWCLWWAQIIINNRKSGAHCYSLLLHLSFFSFCWSIVLLSTNFFFLRSNSVKLLRIQYRTISGFFFLLCIFLLTWITCTVHITYAGQICVPCIFPGQIQLIDQIVAITLSFSNLPLKLPLAVLTLEFLTSETTIIPLPCFSPKVLSVTLSPFAYWPCQTTHCNILSSVWLLVWAGLLLYAMFQYPPPPPFELLHPLQNAPPVADCRGIVLSSSLQSPSHSFGFKPHLADLWASHWQMTLMWFGQL